MAYITKKTEYIKKKPLEKRKSEFEYKKVKSQQKSYKKKSIPYITKRDKKDLVDKAREAFKSLKKHYPKIGTDY